MQFEGPSSARAELLLRRSEPLQRAPASTKPSLGRTAEQFASEAARSREILALAVAADLAAMLGRLADAELVVTTIGLDTALGRLDRRGALAVFVDLRDVDCCIALDPILVEIAQRHEHTAIVAIVPNGPHAAIPSRLLTVCDALISEGDLGPERLLFALGRALERRKLQAQLAVSRRETVLSEASLLLTLISVATPTIVVDDDGKVMFANPEAERMVGSSRCALFGKRPPAEFEGPAATIALSDGTLVERRKHDILWGREPATMVVLVHGGSDLERWRDVGGHALLVQAHLDHAEDALGKLRHVLESDALTGSTVASEVLLGLVQDVLGARGALAGMNRVVAAQHAPDRERHPQG